MMDIRDPSSFYFPAPPSYYVTSILKVSWPKIAAEAPAFTSAFQATRREMRAMQKGPPFKQPPWELHTLPLLHYSPELSVMATLSYQRRREQLVSQACCCCACHPGSTAKRRRENVCGWAASSFREKVLFPEAQ